MIWMDVDTALSEVPVNISALIDDTDFKTREESIVYNQAGMDLVWNFVTTGGAFTQTAVTPTTAGVHDWTNQGNGMYTIEIPASAGTINNDTEGFGWFTGYATGVLPWTGPVIGFRAVGLNDKLIDSAYDTTRGLAGTALPGVAAEGAGGLYTRGTGAGQINQQTAGQVDSNLARWLNVAPLALTSQRVNSNVGAMAANVLTATAINSGAFTIAKFATDVGTTAYASNPIAKAIWERLLSAMVTAGSSGKKLSDIVLQTGDSFARIGAAGVSLTEAGGDGDHLTEAGGTGDHLTAIDLPNQTMDITGDITGNLSGSVGSVTGAVGSVTGEVDANMVKISGDGVAADTLELFAEILNQSTGQLDNGSMDSTLDTYAARVSLYDDDGGTSDRYTCKWYKNGELVKSGITNAKIQVIKDSDGTDLIADTAMTEVGSRGVFKYIATGAERTTAGATYGASVTATIDGATRTDEVDVGRDT